MMKSSLRISLTILSISLPFVENLSSILRGYASYVGIAELISNNYLFSRNERTSHNRNTENTFEKSLTENRVTCHAV